MLKKALRTWREVRNTWRTNWPAASVCRILVTQSGSPAHCAETLRRVRLRFPTARIDVVARDYALQRISATININEIFLVNNADKLALLRVLRQKGYDTVVICATGEPRYWKLKLLAWCLAAKQVISYNEHGGAFVVSRWHRRAIWKHACWRLTHKGRIPDRAPPISPIPRMLRPVQATALLLWLLNACRWEVRRLLHGRLPRA